jgi:hypothetical protein
MSLNQQRQKMDKSSKIESTRHLPGSDRSSVHNAILKASKDRNFISKVLEKLEGLHYPVYKLNILEFMKMHSANPDEIALLKSLNDSVLYHSKYDIKKALEQENKDAKQQYQISDESRKNLHVHPVDPKQKRKDYPETPATAMKNYICDFCGKEFQSKDQLRRHKEFEFKKKRP